MASNTTNYNLVKPAYADDADIADINGNMDIIDGAMKDLADNVADTYSPASTYAVGDRCTYGGVLYKCTTAISTAEAWNSAHWTACTVDEVMASNSGAIDTLQEEIGIVINGNTAAVNVVKGQYVIVKNSTIVGITDGLYTYNDSTTKTAGNTFISSELDAVSNGGLNALNSKLTNKVSGTGQHLFIGDISANSSKTLNVAGGSRTLIIVVGNNDVRMSMAIAFTASTGATTLKQVMSGTNISYDVSTNGKIKVSNTSGGPASLMVSQYKPDGGVSV